jgi:threonine/homoserine/homoserine lactone efflux protein
MQMILKGFKFGLLLQIAIGPVFIFVLKTATESGIFAAEAAVFAATIVDAMFVTLAILGVGKVIDKPKLKNFLKWFGILILCYFGLGIVLSVFNVHIIPGFGELISSVNVTNSFVFCFILTASNPLTILFWTGVFATKMANEGHGKIVMKFFGFGAVLSTFIFLGVVAFIAGLLQPLMTQGIIKILNFIIGIVLISFAVKMIFSKVPL